MADLNNSKAAYDLGIDGTASGGTITGRQILGGLKTVLLSSLNGGNGLGTLGTIDITDRSGHSAAVNLSSAKTLDDVISAINAAAIGVQAQINDAGNGIEIADTTGATASNLIIANGDATNTADKLGLTANAAATSQVERQFESADRQRKHVALQSERRRRCWFGQSANYRQQSQQRHAYGRQKHHDRGRFDQFDQPAGHRSSSAE